MAIAPYRQGELDALCGLYAIINATRLALPGVKCKKSNDYRDFFKFLISSLHTDRMLFAALTSGIGPVDMSRLLAHSDHWVQKKFGVTLRDDRAYYLKGDASRLRVVHAIASHLAEPNTSAMILVDSGPHERHWTVVKKVTENSLVLFDADGMGRISLAGDTRPRIRLRSSGVFLLRCEERTGWPD